MSLHFTVQKEEQLSAIIQLLAPELASNQIIFIEGEVGAGKTTFVRHLLKTIADLNFSNFYFQGSPSFQRENHYHFKKFNLIHFDFYQVENNPNIDLDESIKEYCLLVEWPLEILKKRYQQEALFIKINLEKKKRIIDIQSQNLKWLQKIQ